MAIRIACSSSLGIIVPQWNPVGPPDCLVPIDFQNYIGDVVVPPCWMVRSFCILARRYVKNRAGLFQFFADLVASLSLIFDDVQDTVLGKRRYAAIQIEEIKR